jgi:hypothetical protein
MADQPAQPGPAHLSRPGSLTLRVRHLSAGQWSWSLSWQLADRLPTQAPLLATGHLVDGDPGQLVHVVSDVLAQLLGSDGEHHS